MGRGTKYCGNPECKQPTGPRAYKCKHCGYDFNIDVGSSKRKRKTNGVEFNWRELMPGDYFRTIAGSGPIFPLENHENGYESMGYFGIFKVAQLVNDGIHAYPVDKRNSGHCFIYMGRERMTAMGMLRRPHKIRKLTHQPVITNVVMANGDNK